MYKLQLPLYLKLSLLLGLAVLTRGIAADAPTLRVRADSWMPFNGDPAAKQPGYVVEFLREIFEPQGIKVDYQIMAWDAALKAAAAGEIEGVIGANKKEGAELQIGAEAVAIPQFALFVRRDNAWKYENLHSLQKIKLGAIESYSYWPSLDGYIKKSSAPALKLYSGEAPLAEALDDLVAGRIDALPESVLVFGWATKSRGMKFSDFRVACSEISEPIYVAFSPNAEGKKFARLFDQGLRKLKENGRFDAILESYGFAKN